MPTPTVSAHASHKNETLTKIRLTVGMMSDLPEEMKHVQTDLVVEVDVHRILAEGGKPFDPIMQAVGTVADEGALRLRAPFMPSPLIRVLAREGWAHWVERGRGEDWVVWFYRPR